MQPFRGSGEMQLLGNCQEISDSAQFQVDHRTIVLTYLGRALIDTYAVWIAMYNGISQEICRVVN